MKFIDKSIPELLDVNIDVDSNKIVEFISLLSVLGIDMLEIDKRCIGSVKNFPQGIDYIFKVNSKDDLHFIEEYNFKNFIISIKDNSYERQLAIIEHIYSKFAEKNDVKIVLEIPANSIKELENYFNFYESNLLFRVSGLRIVGLSNSVTLSLKDLIRKVKLKYDIEIDICAENNHFCATGVAVNALSDGIDYITGTFSGLGGEAGYAPIEEVMMASKVIYNMELKGDTTVLQKIKPLIEIISGTVISKDKPILGSDIFLCESGVHVDGIIKNPKNYEPFDPEIVGLKRRIVLGKHSGTTALECILNQNNISYEIKDVPKLLKIIQEKSVELKSFFDGEAVRKLVSEMNLVS